MDFNQAWQRARKGQPSGLFASESVYGYPNTQRRKQYKRQLTPQQQAHKAITYHPQPNPQIWPELSGHSQHRTPGYSPILMQKQSEHARQVFRKAEYFLSRIVEKW